jgi:dinuclear metal center YbgI/SA1388 family protein
MCLKKFNQISMNQSVVEYHAFFVLDEYDMATANDILSLLNIIAPFEISEDWDNSGLQVGNLEWGVKTILIGLDITLPLLEFAIQIKADLVLSHHPLLMKPEKIIDFNLMPGKAIEISAKHKICIVSAHTNLDKAKNGLNDYFASKIGIKNTKPLLPENKKGDDYFEGTGIGRVGRIKEKNLKLSDVVNTIKAKLDLPFIRVTGDINMPISAIAVCTGSGGSLVNEFLDSNADLYITGDMKYHDARKIEESSKALIDVGHFGSEHIAVELLTDKLNQSALASGLDIKINSYIKEKDPFTIY